MRDKLMSRLEQLKTEFQSGQTKLQDLTPNSPDCAKRSCVSAGQSRSWRRCSSRPNPMKSRRHQAAHLGKNRPA